MEPVQRHRSFRSQAVEQLRTSIVTGALQAGSLHSEQSIALSLGLSRTPIREALLQLVGEGLVEFIPHRGVRIAEFRADHLAEVFQFRSAIEGRCAAHLAAHPNPELLARLDAELERQRDILKDGDRLVWVRANMDFHHVLTQSIGNQLMQDAFAPLASHTQRIGYRMNYRRERMSESVDEHSAIVEAIRRRDPERARALAEEHLYITTVLMRQLFADLGLDAK